MSIIEWLLLSHSIFFSSAINYPNLFTLLPLSDPVHTLVKLLICNKMARKQLAGEMQSGHTISQLQAPLGSISAF